MMVGQCSAGERAVCPPCSSPPGGPTLPCKALLCPPGGPHSAAGSPAGGRPGQPPAGGRYIILDRSNHWSDYILLVITVVITAVAASSCVAMAW